METMLRITEETRTELRKFIDSCVDFEGLGYNEPKDNTIQEAVKQLFNECLNYKRSLKAYDFTEALQGLPTYISVPFMNYEISNLIYAFGLEFDRNNDEEYHAACELYWEECGKYLFEVYKSL